MVITREKLREIAGTFLSKLKEEGITHEDVLISRLGCSFPMGGSKDFLEIALGSLEDGTRSRTASYVMRGFGKPLEIQINCVLGYSRIIVKCENRLERYSSFRYAPSEQDGFGNIVQDKQIPTASLVDIMGELEELVAEGS